jgi:hypothetical protein
MSITWSLSVEFEVTIKVKVDEQNNIFGVYDDEVEVLEEMFSNWLHDLDELKVKGLEVYKL